jgi:hypothetical protein
MSKINPLTRNNIDYQKKLRKLNQTHQKQLSKVKDGHELQKIELKSANQIDLENIRSEQDLKIAADLERRDKVLGGIKEGLDKSRKVTSGEIESLKSANEAQKNNQDKNFKLHYESKGIDNDDNMTELNERNNRKTTELRREGLREREETRLNNERDKRAQYQLNRSSINKVKDHHQKKFHQVMKSNETATERQRVDYDKQLRKMQESNTKTENTRQSSHKKKMEVLQDQHVTKVSQENERFQTKYTGTMKSNSDTIDRLNERTGKIIGDIEKRFSNDVEVQLTKMKDNFYHTRNIKPTLTDKGDHYEIKLKIPAHEEKNVQITGQQRKIKVSMSRSLDSKINEAGDQSDVGSGNVFSRTKKVESHTIEMDVADILNANKATRSYTDNHLVFTIAKA